MEIGGILVSSIEFPGKMSLVIFTAGCMLRCPYCHNHNIITSGRKVEIAEIFNEIEDSIDFIDSVVVTGGEPLMQDEEVIEILKFSKDLGLEAKLDTNGYYPETLRNIVNLTDYVALDIKSPFNKYETVIGENIGEQVRKSMDICYESDAYLECRTTYVPGLLNPEDIVDIAKDLHCDVYTIQQFRNKTVLDKDLEDVQNPSRQELLKIAESVKPFLKKVKIKTSEFGDEIVT